ncbi:Fur family transcriptional regulator [Apilactobacillus xinyiensis]|uniref:Transcriptional repressor n=1 Tax=Apilactobacillus xinyiensis TaxID=2841032 RepID=A0ABT0I1B0_9LACO|nr:Fur family transcriptional regulator [Apilactobacillus xinyiensis]MCK8624429.1 transcriptional repressor [Apilactobacillus xinyiensis]
MENDIYQKSLALLRKNKVRITPQRQIILKYLIDHDNHPSVETIYQALADEFSNLSVATIYNNLELFERLGIIIQIPNQDGGVRYDFFGTPHFHAICENCGKIVDIFYPKYKEIEQELKDITKNQSDFIPSTSRIEVYGLCKECQSKMK